MARGLFVDEWVAGGIGGGARPGVISQAAGALNTSSSVAAAGNSPNATNVQRVARAVAANPRMRAAQPRFRRIVW
jgi:hypothetical protein